MRARWLKPESFLERALAKLGPTAYVVYQALRCMADDGGTVEADADLVYGRCFLRWPSISLTEVSLSIAQLHMEGLITLFTHGPDTFAKIDGWKTSDIPHPSKFRHPQIEAGQALTRLQPPEAPEVLSEPSCDPPILDSYNPRLLDSYNPRSAEPKTASASTLEEEAETVIVLPCVGPKHKGRGIATDQLMQWTNDFPAVDVGAELRHMRAWLGANPKRQKTYDGLPRFIVTWLGKKQNETAALVASTAPRRSTGYETPQDRLNATIDRLAAQATEEGR